MLQEGSSKTDRAGDETLIKSDFFGAGGCPDAFSRQSPVRSELVSRPSKELMDGDDDPTGDRKNLIKAEYPRPKDLHNN